MDLRNTGLWGEMPRLALLNLRWLWGMQWRNPERTNTKLSWEFTLGHTQLHVIPTPPYYYDPFLELRKMRHREVKLLAQDHMAPKSQVLRHQVELTPLHVDMWIWGSREIWAIHTDWSFEKRPDYTGRTYGEEEGRGQNRGNTISSKQKSAKNVKKRKFWRLEKWAQVVSQKPRSSFPPKKRGQWS